MAKVNRVYFIIFLLVGLFYRSAFCELSEEFRKKANNLRWVAYAPCNFDPNKGIYPSEESIREDLSLLYDYGFRGIVTYGSDRTLGEIPRIASETGFSGIIMGIWGINSEEETRNAVLAKDYVDGYCMGNEGLYVRYGPDELRRAISVMQDMTDRPVATTEQISDYYKEELLAMGDWLFPNIHPFLSEVRNPAKAAMWICRHYERLKKRCPADKIILFKEVGFPTGGMLSASEQNQKDFLLAMEKTDVPFVYFEAFDQQWKQHPSCEPYWGLFTYKRLPKKYILEKFDKKNP